MNTRTVYSVIVYEFWRYSTEIYRFKKLKNAELFAQNKYKFGHFTPATIEEETDIPAHIADRWTYSG